MCPHPDSDSSETTTTAAGPVLPEPRHVAIGSDGAAAPSAASGSGHFYSVRGGRPLRGEIHVAGAKNAAPKLIIAALLASEPSVLDNVPRIGEVELTLRICSALGVRWRWLGETSLEIDPSVVTDWRIPADVSPEHRCCVIFLAVLLQRVGRAQIALIGGDAIGRRPIDYHLAGLRRLGAEVERSDGLTRLRCSALRGSSIRLDYPSVGATEQLLLAAACAAGRTVIGNAAIEPEVCNLVGFLRAMGACIHQRGRTWVIDGVAALHGARHRVIGDRLEAASYATAAVATRGDIFVRGVEPTHLSSFLTILRAAGGRCEIDTAGIRFRGPRTPRPVTVATAPHPGFMTDWQPPLVVLLTQAEGVSTVHETVYEQRLGYATALGEMGAAIDLHTTCLGDGDCRFRDRGCVHSALITGPSSLVACDLEVPDLRAGFAYLLAALVAEGESTLTDVGNIERGYQAVLAKIRSLGGQIEDGFLGLPAAQRATA